MARLDHNLASGLASSLWLALLNLLLIPFYLKYLGIEAYGLIGFFATIQALLLLLDLGLSPTLNREIARSQAVGKLGEIRCLLHTMAVIYWILGTLGAIFIIIMAPTIESSWLSSSDISRETVYNAIILMGLVFACKWPTSLYQSALMGMQRFVVLSIANACVGTIAGFGALAILAFVSPTIEAFFVWQAIIGLSQTLILKNLTWKTFSTSKSAVRFRLARLKESSKFTFHLGGITISALILSQIDKIILSKLLTLDEFGHYMLATSALSGLYLFISPFFRGISPKLAALVTTGETEKLVNIYRGATWLLASLIFPISAALVFFSESLLNIWTGNYAISHEASGLLSVMALGSVLHGVMHLPYALQLAYGMTRLPLLTNIALVILMPPVIYYLTINYGAIGAAFAWLIFNILYFAIGTWVTHKYILPGITKYWIFLDVGIPFFLSMMFGLIGSQIFKNIDATKFHGLGIAIIVIFFSITTSVTTSPHRALVLKYLKRTLRIGRA